MRFLPAEELRGFDPAISELLTYFESKTNGSRLAKRADIVPSELKPYLPEVCLMEPIYGLPGHVADVKITLQGTSMVSFYGEMTGALVSTHQSPEITERIILSCQTSIDNREPTVVEAEAMSRDKYFLRLRALYVPLAEDGVNIDRLFVQVRVERRQSYRTSATPSQP